jgi:glycosyltransferase involved in cell wall biosynthesis
MSSGPARSFPSVSLIIPAYNEAVNLRECLASLVAQDYPDFEVILVDNASTDDTAQVCAQFPTVRYLYFDRAKSSYAARNEGVRQAKNEMLAFFDADQTALPNYLSMLMAEYVPDDPNHVYCGFLANDPRVPRVIRLSDGDACSTPDPNSEQGRIGTGAVAIPRTLFENLGGFQEEIITGGDHEFFQRAVKRSRVHHCQTPGAYHYYARSVREVFARQEKYGFGRCLIAHHERRPQPSLTRAILHLGRSGLTKTLAAFLVLLRYPRSEWRDRWSVQCFQWTSGLYALRGMLKFRLGYARAGDLPADARAGRVNAASRPRQGEQKTTHG